MIKKTTNFVILENSGDTLLGTSDIKVDLFVERFPNRIDHLGGTLLGTLGTKVDLFLERFPNRIDHLRGTLLGTLDTKVDLFLERFHCINLSSTVANPFSD